MPTPPDIDDYRFKMTATKPEVKINVERQEITQLFGHA
jgi:hypothetical protein